MLEARASAGGKSGLRGEGVICRRGYQQILRRKGGGKGRDTSRHTKKKKKKREISLAATLAQASLLNPPPTSSLFPEEEQSRDWKEKPSSSFLPPFSLSRFFFVRETNLLTCGVGGGLGNDDVSVMLDCPFLAGAGGMGGGGKGLPDQVHSAFLCA